MATSIKQNVTAAQVNKERRPLPWKLSAYVIGSVAIGEPVVVFDPPRAPANAKGTLSNEKLREITKHNQPPQEWYEREEEQLF
jgi:hypothetical protein